ncbi:MAG TPA: DUF2487 family protein [Bacilli bacterium]
MKFSAMEKEKWPELKPFVDTCLLPVSGLTGFEPPWQATERLRKLQQLIDAVEIPFKGRVMIYPALHYLPEGGNTTEYIDHICKNLKQEQFRFIIVAAVDIEPATLPASADLTFLWVKDKPQISQGEIGDAIKSLWANGQDA